MQISAFAAIHMATLKTMKDPRMQGFVKHCKIEIPFYMSWTAYTDPVRITLRRILRDALAISRNRHHAVPSNHPIYE
jgi:hypothetical protein